jgi:hypothetical protein
VLPIRAVLYTLTTNTVALVAIQILDGVGAGIFGVVSVLVIADLTQAIHHTLELFRLKREICHRDAAVRDG